MEAPSVTKCLLAVCLRSALFLVLALGSVACQEEITGSNQVLVQVEIEAPDTARAGSNFEVRIKVSNVGLSNIRNARISAFIPAPLTIVSVGPSAGTTATFSNGPAVSVITWDLGTLDSNSQSHLVVQAVGVLEAAEANRTVTIEATLTGQGIGAGDTVARYNVMITSGPTGPTPTAAPTRTPTLPGPTATPTLTGATATRTPPGATATRTPTLPGPTATSTPPVSTLTPTLPGPTATSTPPGPTATRTPTLPGPTATSTPPAPTATRTPTLPGPTATSTPPAPTATRTPTAPPTATLTPTLPAPTATRTPTAPAPTPTRTPTPGTTNVTLIVRQFEWVFPGGGTSFQMQVGQTYQVQITNTDPPGEDEHGFSGIPALGMSGAVLDPGDTVTRTVMPTSGQTGIHPFSCSEDGCGDGHDDMLGAIQVVP